MIGAAALAVAGVVALQTVPERSRISLDAGVSHVTYDEFLPSAAFYISPAFTASGDRFLVRARGTWLGFESGNHSLQAALLGSWLEQPRPGSAIELGVEIGASRYESFGNFSRLLARTVFHFRSAARQGGWAGLIAGAINSQGTALAAGQFSGGLVFGAAGLDWSVSGSGTLVERSGYADFEVRVRRAWSSGVELEARAAARAGDRDARPGIYGEAAAVLPLSRWSSVVLASGRYPPDWLRGTVGGRYVSAALRFAPPLRPRVRPPGIRSADGSVSDGAAGVPVALVEVSGGRGALQVLVFRAPGAARVELMADFTDWQPVSLEPAGEGLWKLAVRLVPGRYRLNVRLDGGEWLAPAGTTAVEDDFQGTVGTVVVR
ncbi:MAG: hypothetical protein KatS3mg081_2602 [Gemmatimonadales bacterium]|nr:MAG: hypothetical protein KatS3mg081_2602 [Gemmatimonadales bacterium]